MNNLTPQEQKKALKIADHLDRGEVAVVEDILNIENSVEKVDKKVDELKTDTENKIADINKKLEEEVDFSPVKDELRSEFSIAQVDSLSKLETSVNDKIDSVAKDIRKDIPTIPAPVEVDREGIVNEAIEKMKPLIPQMPNIPEPTQPDSPEIVRQKFDSTLDTKGIDAKHILNLEDNIDVSKLKNIPVRTVVEPNFHAGAMETPIKDSVTGRIYPKDASGAYLIPDANNVTAGTLNAISLSSTTTPLSVYQMTNNIDVDFKDNTGASVMYLKESTLNTGFGTNAPDARVHAYKSYSIDSITNLSFSESAPISASNYNAGDSITYQIYAFTDIGTTRVFSSLIEDSYTVLSTAFGVDINWDDVSGADGYRIVSQFIGRGGGADYYADVTTSAFTDTNDNPQQTTPWIAGTPTTTPTSGTIQTRLVYDDGSTTWGLHTLGNVFVSGLDGLKSTLLTASNLTSGRALISSTNGLIVPSAVTSTELGYVSGVTSSIQAQINALSAGGANTALSNLASVAINTSLVSDTDNTDDIGTSSIGWRTGYFDTSVVSPLIIGGSSTTSDLFLRTTSGVGASGADMHFQVGNNGATEAMTILNDGTVGVNNTAPSGARMIVNSTTSATRGLLVIRDGSSSVNPSALGVVNSAVSAEAGALIENGGPNDYGVLRMHGTRVNTNDFLGAFEFGDKTSVADPRVGMILGYAGTASGRGYMSFLTRDAGGFDENCRFQEGGNVGFGFKVYIGSGTTTPTAKLHLAAGSTTAATAPLKFTTGTSMTAAEAGAMEYTTDDLFFTISTGTARKRLLMADPVGGLTSGRVPFATTNGRLTDDADMTFATDTLTVTKIVASTSLDVTGSLQCDSIVNDTGLAAGVYTPTRSAEANMDANVTMFEAQYMRVGNTVTVSGRFTADPTLTATATSFEMTLPVASNIGAVEDLAGVAFCGAIAGQGAQISGSVANNTMVVSWISTDVTAQSWSFTATYQVI